MVYPTIVAQRDQFRPSSCVSSIRALDERVDSNDCLPLEFACISPTTLALGYGRCANCFRPARKADHQWRRGHFANGVDRRSSTFDALHSHGFVVVAMAHPAVIQ